MLEYFENPAESDLSPTFTKFLETCRQHNINGASLDSEIDGAIRRAYERLHETYGQNYRIPHFCRLDLKREDIGTAQRDLSRFEHLLFMPRAYWINFAGFGRSDPNSVVKSSFEEIVIPYSSFCTTIS